MSYAAPAVRRVLPLLLIALTGCGRVERARQCRALARDVNASLAEIQSVSQSSRWDAAAWGDFSRRYAALASRVATHRFGDGSVTRAVDDYRGHLEKSAKACRAMADALGGNSALALAEARREVERVARGEKAGAGRLDGACHAP